MSLYENLDTSGNRTRVVVIATLHTNHLTTKPAIILGCLDLSEDKTCKHENILTIDRGCIYFQWWFSMCISPLALPSGLVKLTAPSRIGPKLMYCIQIQEIYMKHPRVQNIWRAKIRWPKIVHRDVMCGFPGLVLNVFLYVVYQKCCAKQVTPGIQKWLRCLCVFCQATKKKSQGLSGDSHLYLCK